MTLWFSPQCHDVGPTAEYHPSEVWLSQNGRMREFFAETSVAFFGRSDFYPFTREALTKHAPDMVALLQRLWQVTAPPPAPTGSLFDARCHYRLTTQWQGDGMSLGIVNDGGANNMPILAKMGSCAGQMWKVSPVGPCPWSAGCAGLRATQPTLDEVAFDFRGVRLTQGARSREPS